MTLPSSCAECVFYRTGPSRCLRHAPGAGEEEHTPVYWPPPPSTFRCGAGAVADADVRPGERQPGVVTCEGCVHWYQPDGRPLRPPVRFGRTKEWWDRSGYCTRWAPSPSRAEVRKTFHGATHAQEGCGDGDPVDEGGGAGAGTARHLEPAPA